MILRGPILNPRPDGRVEFLPHGEIQTDADGLITAVTNVESLPLKFDDPLILPPFFDNHIHIPQHPIRGRFTEGIDGNPEGGRLLAGLNRNVFPAEARAAERAWTLETIRQFLNDTLSNGVVGGAAYMTVHTSAAILALEKLPSTWHVGLVLMNQHCPEYLRTDEAALEQDVELLAGRFGQRFLVTDRFAVAVGSSLRRRAANLALRYGLRMQTHLNEQIAEREYIKNVLYPSSPSYTHVYLEDGLLDRSPLLAHCVRMDDEEFDLVRDHNASIVHCPISNTLLGSGIMPLDKIKSRGIDYAICTDVGASPTTSIMTEMVHFLINHRGRSSHATPSEALYRTTLGPAKMLGIDRRFGSFDVGKPLSYIEVDPFDEVDPLAQVDDVIADNLLGVDRSNADPADLDRLEKTGISDAETLARLDTQVRSTADRLQGRVRKVVLTNRILFDRTAPSVYTLTV